MSSKQHRPQQSPTASTELLDMSRGQMAFPDNSVMLQMMGTATDMIGGLFEPEHDEATMEDRAQASTELHGRFTIVQNESDADGNAVTQEQFDEIVAMYSDIRMGKTNIEIGEGLSGEALEAFKNGTMDDIGRILQTESGRALLKDAMHAEDKDGNALKTRITQAEDRDDPYTQADNEARAKGKKGSGARVAYEPGHTVEADVDPRKKPGSWGDEFRSDVVLYHELAHAKHMRDGELGGSVDLEERNTVGMGREFDPQHFQYFENRYRHERRQIGHGQWGGVVEGDEDMGQRDNFDGGETNGLDYVVPYEYAGDEFPRGRS